MVDKAGTVIDIQCDPVGGSGDADADQDPVDTWEAHEVHAKRGVEDHHEQRELVMSRETPYNRRSVWQKVSCQEQKIPLSDNPPYTALAPSVPGLPQPQSLRSYNLARDPQPTLTQYHPQEHRT